MATNNNLLHNIEVHRHGEGVDDLKQPSKVVDVLSVRLRLLLQTKSDAEDINNNLAVAIIDVKNVFLRLLLFYKKTRF